MIFSQGLCPSDPTHITLQRTHNAWEHAALRIVDEIIVPLLVRIETLDPPGFRNPYYRDATWRQVFHPECSVSNVMHHLSNLLEHVFAGRYNAELDGIVLQAAAIINPDTFVRLVETHIALRSNLAFPHSAGFIQRVVGIRDLPPIQMPRTIVSFMRRARAIKPFRRAVVTVGREREDARRFCHELLETIDGTQIAVAMALHRRLGQQSLMAALSVELVQNIVLKTLDGEEDQAAKAEVDGMELYY